MDGDNMGNGSSSNNTDTTTTNNTATTNNNNGDGNGNDDGNTSNRDGSNGDGEGGDSPPSEGLTAGQERAIREFGINRIGNGNGTNTNTNNDRYARTTARQQGEAWQRLIRRERRQHSMRARECAQRLERRRSQRTRLAAAQRGGPAGRPGVARYRRLTGVVGGGGRPGAAGAGGNPIRLPVAIPPGATVVVNVVGAGGAGSGGTARGGARGPPPLPPGVAGGARLRIGTAAGTTGVRVVGGGARLASSSSGGRGGDRGTKTGGTAKEEDATATKRSDGAAAPPRLVNDEGFPVARGTDEPFDELYYCDRFLGREVIPGSDGRCGPNDGPQCASCRRFQSSRRLLDLRDRFFPGHRSRALTGEEGDDDVSRRGVADAEVDIDVDVDVDAILVTALRMRGGIASEASDHLRTLGLIPPPDERSARALARRCGLPRAMARVALLRNEGDVERAQEWLYVGTEPVASSSTTTSTATTSDDGGDGDGNGDDLDVDDDGDGAGTITAMEYCFREASRAASSSTKNGEGGKDRDGRCEEKEQPATVHIPKAVRALADRAAFVPLFVGVVPSISGSSSGEDGHGRRGDMEAPPELIFTNGHRMKRVPPVSPETEAAATAAPTTALEAVVGPAKESVKKLTAMMFDTRKGPADDAGATRNTAAARPPASPPTHCALCSLPVPSRHAGSYVCESCHLCEGCIRQNRDPSGVPVARYCPAAANGGHLHPHPLRYTLDRHRGPLCDVHGPGCREHSPVWSCPTVCHSNFDVCGVCMGNEAPKRFVRLVGRVVEEGEEEAAEDDDEGVEGGQGTTRRPGSRRSSREAAVAAVSAAAAGNAIDHRRALAGVVRPRPSSYAPRLGRARAHPSSPSGGSSTEPSSGGGGGDGDIARSEEVSKRDVETLWNRDPDVVSDLLFEECDDVAIVGVGRVGLTSPADFYDPAHGGGGGGGGYFGGHPFGGPGWGHHSQFLADNVHYAPPCPGFGGAGAGTAADRAANRAANRLRVRAAAARAAYAAERQRRTLLHAYRLAAAPGGRRGIGDIPDWMGHNRRHHHRHHHGRGHGHGHGRGRHDRSVRRRSKAASSSTLIASGGGAKRLSEGARRALDSLRNLNRAAGGGGGASKNAPSSSSSLCFVTAVDVTTAEDVLQRAARVFSSHGGGGGNPAAAGAGAAGVVPSDDHAVRERIYAAVARGDVGAAATMVLSRFYSPGAMLVRRRLRFRRRRDRIGSASAAASSSATAAASTSTSTSTSASAVSDEKKKPCEMRKGPPCGSDDGARKVGRQRPTNSEATETSPSSPPVDDDDDNDGRKPLTMKEKEMLTETIDRLSPDELSGVIGIIREESSKERKSSSGGDDDDEDIDLEIDRLDTSAQRRLQRYVTKHFGTRWFNAKKKARPPSDAAPAAARAAATGRNGVADAGEDEGDDDLDDDEEEMMCWCGDVVDDVTSPDGAVGCLNGHAMHASCAADWLLARGGGSCPTCRTPLFLPRVGAAEGRDAMGRVEAERAGAGAGARARGEGDGKTNSRVAKGDADGDGRGGPLGPPPPDLEVGDVVRVEEDVVRCVREQGGCTADAGYADAAVVVAGGRAVDPIHGGWHPEMTTACGLEGRVTGVVKAAEAAAGGGGGDGYKEKDEGAGAVVAVRVRCRAPGKKRHAFQLYRSPHPCRTCRGTPSWSMGGKECIHCRQCNTCCEREPGNYCQNVAYEWTWNPNLLTLLRRSSNATVEDERHDDRHLPGDNGGAAGNRGRGGAGGGDNELVAATKSIERHMQRLRAELASVKAARESVTASMDEAKDAFKSCLSAMADEAPLIDSSSSSCSLSSSCCSSSPPSSAMEGEDKDDVFSRIAHQDCPRARHLLNLAREWDGATSSPAYRTLWNDLCSGHLDSASRTVRRYNAALAVREARWADALAETAVYVVSPAARVGLIASPVAGSPKTGFSLEPRSRFRSKREYMDKNGAVWLEVGECIERSNEERRRAGNGIVADPTDPESSRALVGARVRRGEDWRYGDQDGGEQNEGVIVGFVGDDSVAVQWDGIHRLYSYRAGTNGARDLAFARPLSGGEVPAEVPPPQGWLCVRPGGLRSPPVVSMETGALLCSCCGAGLTAPNVNVASQDCYATVSGAEIKRGDSLFVAATLEPVVVESVEDDDRIVCSFVASSQPLAHLKSASPHGTGNCVMETSVRFKANASESEELNGQATLGTKKRGCAGGSTTTDGGDPKIAGEEETNDLRKKKRARVELSSDSITCGSANGCGAVFDPSVQAGGAGLVWYRPKDLVYREAKSIVVPEMEDNEDDETRFVSGHRRSRRELVLMFGGKEEEARKAWKDASLTTGGSPGRMKSEKCSRHEREERESSCSFASCLRGHLLHPRCLQRAMLEGGGCPAPGCKEALWVPNVKRATRNGNGEDDTCCGGDDECGGQDASVVETDEALRSASELSNHLAAVAAGKATGTSGKEEDQLSGQRHLKMCPACCAGPVLNEECDNMRTHHGQCTAALFWRRRRRGSSSGGSETGPSQCTPRGMFTASASEIAESLTHLSDTKSVADVLPKCPGHKQLIMFNGCMSCGHLFTDIGWTDMPAWDPDAKAKLELEGRKMQAARLLSDQVRKEAGILQYEREALCDVAVGAKGNVDDV